ncbi:DoxX family protein [Candidatus Azambacteria bacterium]|nr:DoxX family protein [Candidatus Azambacteria bacterium]
MSRFFEKLKPFAPLCLRLGLAAVFLFFGLEKFYASGQASAEIDSILEIGLDLASLLNFILGIVEIIIGLSFILGWGIRWTAPVAAILIIVIFFLIILKFGLRLDPTISRDIGLIGACLALWFLGAGQWSIDED